MIIPYEKNHWGLIDLRDHEKEAFKLTSLIKVAEKSVTFTVINEDKQIVTIGGLLPNHEESKSEVVWEIWQCPSLIVSKNTNLFSSAANKLIEIAKCVGARKLTTTCLADDIHDRWIGFLKFKKIGETIINEKNYNRYERVL